MMFLFSLYFVRKLRLFNNVLNLFKNCIKQGCLITPYKGGYFNQVENITLFNKIGLNN